MSVLHMIGPGARTWHPILTLVLIDKIKIFVSLSYSKTAFGVFMLYEKKHGALEMNNMSFIKINDEKGNKSIRSALIRKKQSSIYSVKFEKNFMQTAYPLK